jgi:hypothetical protein
MADGVSVPEFSIHQALHGYSDGHRQIALSTALTPQDSKLLMTLSDSSGSGARFPKSGYLTGYPLVESGYYVLARTWPAPEMSRPGCVWTHSLLIDFTELATLSEVGELLQFFQRPSADNFARFGVGFVYSPSNRSSKEAAPVSGAETLLSALYGEPNARVTLSSSLASSEALVLQIWSQQWPRLRRSFRFCTCAAADRSTKVAPFDLQILPSENTTVRSRFVDTLDAARHPYLALSWIEDAVEDLTFPDRKGLRTFLRQVGGDVSAGRGAFAVICRLHALLTGIESAHSALGDAVELLESQFDARQARAARLAIAKMAVRNIQSLGEASFEFLLRNLDIVIVAADNDDLARIGGELWARSPQRLERLFAEGSAGSAVVEQTLDQIPIETLAMHAAEVPDLIEEILIRRPSIVAEPQFWIGLGELSKVALTYAGKSSVLASIAAKTLIAAGRADLAAEAINILGGVPIGRAIIEADPYRIDGAWVNAIASHPELLAQLFTEGGTCHRYLLVLLAQAMAPDDLPNDVGQEDPWITALVSSRGDVAEREEFYFLAFMMARALGVRSQSSAEIMVQTFHPVYVALAERRMPEDGWQLIDRRLPWTMFESDRCVRLREVVVRVCIDRAFSPMTFHFLTPDDRIFESIILTMATTSRGRAYLKHVRKLSKDSHDVRYTLRNRLIDKLI